MRSFLLILEECLTALSDNISTVDECLARYPQHAELLEPLLRTARFLKNGRKLKSSQTFKTQSRSHLIQHLRFNPHHSRRMQLPWRVAALTLALLVSTLFITGTVHAQSALPGDNFYPWKRASEEVWRALAINPIDTNIVLSERRLNEWMAVADDPLLNADARRGYFAELNRLQGLDNAQTHKLIVPVIKNHQEVLDDAGLPGAELVGNYLIPPVTPAPVVVTQIQVTNTTLPTLTPQPTFTLRPNPTATQTDEPTSIPTDEPTSTPTDEPTVTPTDEPTSTPTDEPTATPTDVPTATDIPVPPFSNP